MGRPFDVLEPEPDQPISLLADSEAARGRQSPWPFVQQAGLICVGLSRPVEAAREVGLLASVRTMMPPLSAASSGLVPSKSISTASSCLSVRTTSSLLTTDLGTLLFNARITRTGTMLSTLVKMFRSSPTSFRD